MNPDRLFALMTVFIEQAVDPPNSKHTYKWLLHQGFIEIAPTLTGLKVTAQGRKVIESAFKTANQMVD